MNYGKEKINVLFISYDGMTDPLGQSQVIPYLAGLVAKGVDIHLISFEKKERFEANKQLLANVLKKADITWHPMPYTKSPPIFSTLYDIEQLHKKVNALNANEQFDILHCRGYITSMVGLRLSKSIGLPFIFDMRAFFADERVDGGHWNQSNPIYRMVYQYFKKKEIKFLENAAHTISLTEKGKNIIHSWEKIKNNPVPITVIPCCADLDLFDYQKIKSNNVAAKKAALGISETDKVLCYSGSVGTWYMPDEMLDFYIVFRKKFPRSKFLFITTESPTFILEKALQKNIPAEEIIITPSSRAEMPLHLAVADFALFFIKPVFSKSGSSPTKMGEIMGMGLPLICNGGVGDVDLIVHATDCGVYLSEFTKEAYEKTLDKALATTFNKEKIRAGAFEYYDLGEGVNRYYKVYQKILQSHKNKK